MAISSARTDANRAAILAHIGAHGATSRADLARGLGLSPALITKLTRDLLADGLLTELEHSPSRGGRPALLLGLTAGSFGAIGVKVAPDHLTLVEVGLGGAVTRTATEQFDATHTMALAQLTDAVSAFCSSSTHANLLGVGVGLPGNVLEQSEGVVDSTQLGWSQLPLGLALRNATDLPVLIDNNVNALALAESLFGTGRGHENFLVVTIGTGIGAGIVAGGAVVRGHSGNAGEIGHLPMAENGPRCQCGALGCLEAIIGQSALIETARREGVIGADAGITALATVASGGNEAAQRIFAEAGHLLGRAIAGVVNTLDPELIVILGEGAESWKHWSMGFEPALRSSVMPRKRGIEVAVEGWQDDRWAQGAASLVLSTPFDADGVSGEQGRLVRARLIDAAAGNPA
ncbi:ROK family transcriptional regulator [Demequina sp.]|uniref:ROK family transcriptional regulator n=1 Tax=Demequina sp. TaxID=2050685 RepID=UPI0025BCAB7D|nr:ROK family transcriptional regulator [Demequina sp.]